ncbi:HRI1 domain protein [Ilyonectria robusta]
MGSISLREHIRWLPDEASEPTSTVVVTSPQRRYVDLRIFRPEGDQKAWSGQEEALPVDRLEWGIAGTSSSWMRDDGKGGQIRHSQWEHWIDSHTTEPENATDEGDMFPQPDGTTLETGSMVNPATGKDTAYEEVWLDVEPIPTSTSDVKSIVLHMETETGGRGSVVRLGQYCQGFLREGDLMTAERWEWEAAKGWKRTIRMGDAELPCEKVLDDGLGAKKDEVVEIGGNAWKVVEVSGE